MFYLNCGKFQERKKKRKDLGREFRDSQFLGESVISPTTIEDSRSVKLYSNGELEGTSL